MKILLTLLEVRHATFKINHLLTIHIHPISISKINKITQEDIFYKMCKFNVYTIIIHG